VPRISQLTSDETADLFLSVQRVSRTIERVYNASALNVAIQDGVDAGQSVPHVHVHIIPRKLDDLEEQGGGDKIYSMMDSDDGNIGKAFLQMQQRLSQRANRQDFTAAPDSDRKPRSQEEMSAEASWLQSEMIKDDLT
jgi:bis(5'-adenosyl)-triphosphatase